jgi:molybdopterin-guanine dinucleotide biosynthesis protein A
LQPTRPLLGGILIGGDSVRMGRSKALLEHDGVTFAERVVAAVTPHVTGVVMLGAGAVPESLSGIARLADERGAAGPLGGMLAALRWRRDACWVIVACDLPMLRPEAVDWLLTQRSPTHRAVLPKTGKAGVEPLAAVYEPEALGLLESLLSRGIRSPSRLDGLPGVHTPTPPADLLACWTNVNTPEELARLTMGG